MSKARFILENEAIFQLREERKTFSTSSMNIISSSFSPSTNAIIYNENDIKMQMKM